MPIMSSMVMSALSGQLAIVKHPHFCIVNSSFYVATPQSIASYSVSVVKAILI